MNVHRVSSSKWSINVCLISCSKVSNSVSGGVSMITRVWNCDTKSSFWSHFLRRKRFCREGRLRYILGPLLNPPRTTRHRLLRTVRSSSDVSTRVDLTCPGDVVTLVLVVISLSCADVATLLGVLAFVRELRDWIIDTISLFCTHKQKCTLVLWFYAYLIYGVVILISVSYFLICS